MTTARDWPGEGDRPRYPDSSEIADEHVLIRLPAERPALPLLDGSSGLLAASHLALGIKRTVDVVVASALILLLSPVFAAVALAVKKSSPGPVLYWSTRVGKDGARFRLPKFRSMFVDAEERLQHLIPLNEANGPVFKIREDPRITPVGHWLRRTSLDELPQLFTVLTGEMSLVGPRPPLEVEVATYTPLERQRLSVKPGLTCIWQVSGRSDLDFDTWMQMDLDYIRHWTPGTDLQLLLRTLPAVASGRGAY